MKHIDKNSLKHFGVCFILSLFGLYGVSAATGVSVKEGSRVFDNSNTIEGWVLFGDIWKAVIPTNTGT